MNIARVDAHKNDASSDGIMNIDAKINCPSGVEMHRLYNHWVDHIVCSAHAKGTNADVTSQATLSSKLWY